MLLFNRQFVHIFYNYTILMENFCVIMKNDFSQTSCFAENDHAFSKTFPITCRKIRNGLDFIAIVVL